MNISINERDIFRILDRLILEYDETQYGEGYNDALEDVRYEIRYEIKKMLLECQDSKE